MAIKRAITVDQIEEKVFNEAKFEAEWKASFGRPELAGVWLIWGNSGNGKTDFAMKLAKYLTNFGKVAYDTLEEGVSKSIKMAVKRNQLKEVKRRFMILDREPFEDLKTRLSKRKSPDIVIIDSLQYMGLSVQDYRDLKEMFPRKLFIFISHAKGREPKGSVAIFARYDANVKIHVDGYVANITSRYGGGEPFVIWEEGANKLMNN